MAREPSFSSTNTAAPADVTELSSLVWKAGRVSLSIRPHGTQDNEVAIVPLADFHGYLREFPMANGSLILTRQFSTFLGLGESSDPTK